MLNDLMLDELRLNGVRSFADTVRTALDRYLADNDEITNEEIEEVNTLIAALNPWLDREDTRQDAANSAVSQYKFDGELIGWDKEWLRDAETFTTAVVVERAGQRVTENFVVRFEPDSNKVLFAEVVFDEQRPD